MKRAIILIICLVISVLAASACGKKSTVYDVPSALPSATDSSYPESDASPPVAFRSPTDPTSLLPDELRKIIQDSRRTDYAPASADAVNTVKSYLNVGLDANTDAALAAQLEQIKNEAASVDYPDTLSHTQVQNELDYLFTLLQYGYGAYGYFGGDKAFGALKQEMEIALTVMPDPISTSDYQNKLLMPYLHLLIADNHFQVFGPSGNNSAGITNCFCTCANLFFYKSGDEYTTTVDGTAYKLAGHDNSSELLPTLDADGKLAYTLGRMMKRGSIGNASVGLTDEQTGQTVTRYFHLNSAPMDYLDGLSTELYTKDTIDGIPVVSNRFLYAQTEDQQSQLTDFIATGAELRNEPVAILDLRNNGGGSDTYASQWVRGYTGAELYYPFLYAARLSETALTINSGGGGYTPVGDTMWSDVLHQTPPKQIPNPNLLIVLTDGMCGSAGDSFVGYLREVENVIFVGEPTMGCLLSGSVGSTLLPESKLTLQFGINLNLPRNLSVFEGNGFAPDLWMPPGESLERVIKYLLTQSDSANNG